ncbi:MAG TPA: hypothetical protein VKT29_13570, partial [Terriglobales bacterium]|nr:hypothetical protein [Terriglobales bacterium]
MDRRRRGLAVGCAMVLVCGAFDVAPADAAEAPAPQLRAETRQAFERYVRLTDERNTAELARERNLLWVDG